MDDAFVCEDSVSSNMTSLKLEVWIESAELQFIWNNHEEAWTAFYFSVFYPTFLSI